MLVGKIRTDNFRILVPSQQHKATNIIETKFHLMPYEWMSRNNDRNSFL